MIAPTANPASDKARTETYARAICRVYVEETARVMRIKVSELWVSSRVDRRWPEYAGQALAALALADAEMEPLQAIAGGEITEQEWKSQAEIGRLNRSLADAETREADLRRERNALVAAMAESVIRVEDRR